MSVNNKKKCIRMQEFLVAYVSKMMCIDYINYLENPKKTKI